MPLLVTLARVQLALALRRAAAGVPCAWQLGAANRARAAARPCYQVGVLFHLAVESCCGALKQAHLLVVVCSSRLVTVVAQLVLAPISALAQVPQARAILARSLPRLAWLQQAAAVVHTSALEVAAAVSRALEWLSQDALPRGQEE